MTLLTIVYSLLSIFLPALTMLGTTVMFHERHNKDLILPHSRASPFHLWNQTLPGGIWNGGERSAILGENADFFSFPVTVITGSINSWTHAMCSTIASCACVPIRAIGSFMHTSENIFAYPNDSQTPSLFPADGQDLYTYNASRILPHSTSRCRYATVRSRSPILASSNRPEHGLCGDSSPFVCYSWPACSPMWGYCSSDAVASSGE